MGAICSWEVGWLTLRILSMTLQPAPSLILSLIAKSMEDLTSSTSNMLGNLIHVPYPGTVNFLNLCANFVPRFNIYGKTKNKVFLM